MILYSAAAQIYQAMQYVDRAGKQSFEILLFGVPGQSGAAERRYQRTGQGGHDHDPLYRVGHQDAGHTDPGGHQGFSSGSIYFSTMEYAEIPAGSLTVDVLAECTATGNAGNGLAPGEVSTIVDPVPTLPAP